MMPKWIKRALLAIATICLVIIQVVWINGSLPWLNLVFLFVVLYTGYSQKPGSIGLAAFAGFFLEAFAIHQTGLQFITLVGAVIVMLLLEKTVLAHNNALSIGVLILAGAVTFAIGSYIQALLISSAFFHHPTIIYRPFMLLLLFFCSVIAAFTVHGLIKAGLDRWAPKTHKRIYGEL